MFTGNTQRFKKPSGLTDEDIRGALSRNKVDITREFGNLPAPVPGSSKLGSVSYFTSYRVSHIEMYKVNWP